MSQFDIHEVSGGRVLLCRIQTDFGTPAPFLLCAPAIPIEEWGPISPKLHIRVEIGERTHLIIMTQLAAVPAQSLGAIIGSAAPAHDDIIRAVDILVTGF